MTNSYSFHSKFFLARENATKMCLTYKYASSSKKFMLPWVLDKLPFKVSWVKKWIIGQKMHTLRQMSWLQNYAGNVHVEETFWYAKWNTAWLARLKSLSFQQIIFFLQKSHEDFFKQRIYIYNNCSLFLQKWNIYLYAELTCPCTNILIWNYKCFLTIVCLFLQNIKFSSRYRESMFKNVKFF